jgi:hypothetical protein
MSLKKKEKYYVIDGKIKIRFPVAGLNEEVAKNNAVRMVRKLLETSLLGFGYSFKVEEITETQPISKREPVNL